MSQIGSIPKGLITMYLFEKVQSHNGTEKKTLQNYKIHIHELNSKIHIGIRLTEGCAKMTSFVARERLLTFAGLCLQRATEFKLRFRGCSFCFCSEMPKIL